jgi:DNA (cytosine-5)-methyltransferase 1
MKPTLLDLFSGSGGVTQGFKNQGFQTLAAVEWDHIAAETYKINHPDAVMYEKDIRKVKPQELLQRLKLSPGELTVLTACAPCQPFSRQTRLSKKDGRTQLILKVLPFVEVFQPKYIMMENVPGLNKGKNRAILNKLIKSLRQDHNYKVFGPFIVDAVSYGVPQFRKRLILLASREHIILSLPEVTHVSPENAKKLEKAAWKTVKEAFKGIEKLRSGQKSKTDPLHQARKHTKLNLDRLKHIPKNGGSRHSLPNHLQLACHKEGTGYNDVYGRMDFRRPANTLTTGCTNFTKGRYAHPTANRAITPREAARLQTFPDQYYFVGNHDQLSVQIGNAVPVLLAEAFARYFLQIQSKGKES